MLSVVSIFCLIGAVLLDRKLYTAPRMQIMKNFKSTGQKKINPIIKMSGKLRFHT